MKIVGIIALIALVLFGAPWFVLLGWNAAREMWPTLPEATYWQAFWISNAVSIMFKTSRFVSGNKN